MKGITQGLYYIEKVQQYNSNIVGFPSDLINDRIASIIDSKKGGYATKVCDFYQLRTWF